MPALICDVDGVLVDSPHEQAWRAALDSFAPQAGFTTAFYQAHVAGKPRQDGAVAALTGLGVPDAAGRAAEYAERKQRILEGLIASGSFAAFADAQRLLLAARAAGWKLAAASSSKNASAMMRAIRLGAGTLKDLFDADLCGRDMPHGKPAPDLFLAAAAELGTPPAACWVIEDAPAGIRAAKAGGMAALGIARHDDAAPLRRAGADLVVSSLDCIDTAALAQACLRARKE